MTKHRSLELLPQGPVLRAEVAFSGNLSGSLNIGLLLRKQIVDDRKYFIFPIIRSAQPIVEVQGVGLVGEGWKRLGVLSEGSLIHNHSPIHQGVFPP